MERRTYGAEIEKPVTDLKTGLPYCVSQNFFKNLGEQAKNRGQYLNDHTSDLNNDVIGVRTEDLGEQGVDNGFNLLETSLPYQSSLEELLKIMELDLASVQEALRQEGASVINLSIHPLGKRDLKTYQAYVAPKGIYPYLWYRGWDHTAGIDARAQNSPTTGVGVDKAADACTVVIAAGAAFIGLYGNSPYEEGNRSSYKEARLTMWERMMRYAKIEGDRTTARFPQEPFQTLAQYFNWMFGNDTAIHFIIASEIETQDEEKGGNYKGIGDRIIIIPESPSVLEYLSRSSWQGLFLRDIFNGFNLRVVEVIPDISHIEAMQWSQFTGARIRYGLKHHGFPLQEFLEACKNPDQRRVEEIFQNWANFMYIEGRDAGANFPDREIFNSGTEIARSVLISPSAIQAGLIANLEKAKRFIYKYPWLKLKALRDVAIRNGLEGEVDDTTVYDFTKQVLEIAAGGLSESEQKLLKYPQWVLETRQNGADRAIEFLEKQRGISLEEALKRLVVHRQVVLE